jgi:hypothetical protein
MRFSRPHRDDIRVQSVKFGVMRRLSFFFFLGTVALIFIVCAALGLAGAGSAVLPPKKPRPLRPKEICKIHGQRMDFYSVPVEYGTGAKERAAKQFGDSYTNMAIAFIPGGQGPAETSKYVCAKCSALLEESLSKRNPAQPKDQKPTDKPAPFIFAPG